MCRPVECRCLQSSLESSTAAHTAQEGTKGYQGYAHVAGTPIICWQGLDAVQQPNIRSHTELDGIVAGEERKHADNGGKPWTLAICDNAHGYARRIHAQIGGGSLAL